LDYDEFGFLQDYAANAGIVWLDPTVARRTFVVDGRELGALQWGDTAPKIVYMHGRGQNAHTWDSVAMAVGAPALAIDLPGHGHSSWREDHDYSPVENANAVRAVLREELEEPAVIVGMSMGGLTAIHLAAAWPELVAALVIVDITPGMPGRQELGPEDRGAAALLGGPTEFASFEEMLASVRGLLPERADTGLYGGVRHNSRQLEDGTWTWRYDPIRGQGNRGINRDALWEDFSSLTAPTMLVRGGDSRFTQDVDIAEVQRRKPSTRIEVVSGAGHSVQGAQPVVLAGLIEDFAGSLLDS
jgi:esterase